jgi:hypothetical protein
LQFGNQVIAKLIIRVQRQYPLARNSLQSEIALASEVCEFPVKKINLRTGSHNLKRPVGASAVDDDNSLGPARQLIESATYVWRFVIRNYKGSDIEHKLLPEAAFFPTQFRGLRLCITGSLVSRVNDRQMIGKPHR